MTPRLRHGLAIAAVALLGLASPALAGDTVTSGTWGGSKVERPAPVTDPATRTVSINGSLRDNGGFVGRPSMAATFATPPGCPTVPDQPITVHGGSLEVRRTFSSSGPFPAGACNGAYRVAIFISGVERMDTELVVDLPAPPVTGLATEPSANGRSITVSWDDARSQAPDLEGYSLERQLGDGEFELVAALAADVTRFVDDDLPTAAGTATYRVSSRRSSPSGPKVSATSASEPTRFQARPATDPAPGPGSGGGGGGSGPGGDGPGGDGGTGPGDGPGPDVGSGGGLGSGPRRPAIAPRVGFSRSFLPPLLTPRISPEQAGRSTTPTTIDDGFDEDLPYDPIDGPLEAEAPDDELAAFFTDDIAGRGMAIPVATALVLAGWAMHLRALARAARPTD